MSFDSTPNQTPENISQTLVQTAINFVIEKLKLGQNDLNLIIEEYCLH